MSDQQKYDILTYKDKLVSNLRSVTSSLNELPSQVSAICLAENRMLKERKREFENIFAKIDEIRGLKDAKGLQIKLDEANKTIVLLKHERTDIILQKKTLETSQKDYDEQVSVLKEILQERNEKIEELEETIEKRNYELAVSKKNGKEFKEQLRKTYFYQSEEIDKLNILLKNKDVDIEDLKKQLKNKDINIEDFQAVLKSNEKKDNEIAKLKQTIEKLQSALDEYEDELDNDPLVEFNEIKQKILDVVE